MSSVSLTFSSGRPTHPCHPSGRLGITHGHIVTVGRTQRTRGTRDVTEQHLSYTDDQVKVECIQYVLLRVPDFDTSLTLRLCASESINLTMLGLYGVDCAGKSCFLFTISVTGTVTSQVIHHPLSVLGGLRTILSCRTKKLCVFYSNYVCLLETFTI